MITLFAGGYVLLNPGISLRTFVLVTGVVLILQGVLIAIVRLLRRRGER